jgi:hypothetical protein
VQERDAAGNWSASGSFAITIDAVGNFSASTDVTATTLKLNWSAASDNVTSQAALEYFVCSGASAAAIDTVAECESATQEMAYTANTLTLALTGKSPATTYYFNVVVRDGLGNKAVYPGKAQSTLVPIASQSTLGTSNAPLNSAGYRDGNLRHTFFDTVHGLHWALYADGGELKLSRSVDGATWTPAGSLTPTGLGKFTLHFKAIGGTAYVFLVSEENTYDIILRRGTLSATSITWDTPVTVYDGTANNNLYRSPSVVTDDTNVWVAAARFDGFSWSTQVRESTNDASA